MFVKNVQEFILNSTVILVISMLIYCAMLTRDYFTVRRAFARPRR